MISPDIQYANTLTLIAEPVSRKHFAAALNYSVTSTPFSLNFEYCTLILISRTLDIYDPHSYNIIINYSPNKQIHNLHKITKKWRIAVNEGR